MCVKSLLPEWCIVAAAGEKICFDVGFLCCLKLTEKHPHLEAWGSTSSREERSVVAWILEESCTIALSLSRASVFFEVG